MSAKSSPLTVVEINALKPKENRYRIWDEKGLYIEVTPNGSKLWRYKYRFQGKEKLLSFGPYPRVSLAEAREEREKAWKILNAGNDPAIAKKNTAANNTFQLNERGYRPDIIEAQLSHKEGDKVRAAYNRAQYMQERRQLMQDWADYLDTLKANR